MPTWSCGVGGGSGDERKERREPRSGEKRSMYADLEFRGGGAVWGLELFSGLLRQRLLEELLAHGAAPPA